MKWKTQKGRGRRGQNFYRNLPEWQPWNPRHQPSGKWGKKKEKQNSQKTTITLPFFISNRPKITLQHNNFVLYTFYKNASFSIAMTTFTLKLIPACCKKHHACKEWWEPSYAKEWVINIYIYIWHTNRPCQHIQKIKTTFIKDKHYWERIDCNASCCWGPKDDQVDARVDGGNVCWSCLSRLIILLTVCSVARSLPAHRT